MATAATPRLQQPTSNFSLASLQTKGKGLPNRHIWHMVEGWGKTSLAAQTPNPVFLMSQGETGLETLIDNGRLKETPHFPECQTWADALSALRVLLNETHEFKTLVIDTLNGMERLCHQYICDKHFGGNWDDKGFSAYGRGPEVSLPEWTLFLNDLDKLREKRKMSIILLSHTKVKPFKNPMGPDYDRYTPDMHEKTWGISHKWADVVLFGNFESIVFGGEVRDDGKHKKGKAGDGNAARIIYAEKRSAFDAKNRLGLASEIEISSESPEAAWGDLMTAFRAAKGDNK